LNFDKKNKKNNSKKFKYPISALYNYQITRMFLFFQANYSISAIFRHHPFNKSTVREKKR
jgi:hypothetical protein